MNPSKPELTFTQCRQIMRSENVPTNTMNNQAEEKQALATANPAQLMKVSTDCAAVCREIVKRTAVQIKGRQYVKVEGFMAIATAHGCIAGARDVEKVEGGFRAIGELRRISDGALLAIAEGFCGEDEVVWWGGVDQGGKTWPKRPEYAIRAMASTRAISRVCRSAFAHVVVLIDSDLSSTPAEEMDSIDVTSAPQLPLKGVANAPPLKYDQELDLVNRELEEAAHRKRGIGR
jgi:hypothetical protein